MEIIKVNLATDWNNPAIIQKAMTVIQRNGSLVYPTDTVYGLGVSALRVHCLERLFKIKKRPETKPVPVMVRDIAMAKKLAFVDKKTEKVLTVIYRPHTYKNVEVPESSATFDDIP